MAGIKREIEKELAELDKRQDERRGIKDYRKLLKIEIQKIKTLHSHTASLILRFYREYCIQGGLTLATASRNLAKLRSIALDAKKPLTQLTKNDINALVQKWQSAGSKPEGVLSRTRVLKTFLRWHLGLARTEVIPAFRGVVLPKVNLGQLDKDDLLNSQELTALVNHARNPMHKAVLIMLIESGCRIGELGGSKLSSVKIDEDGLDWTIRGETSKSKRPRTLRLVLARHYMNQWLESHPLKHDPDAPLFVSINGEAKPLTYENISMNIIGRSAKRAGIKKRVNPHWFRHTSATYYAPRMKYPEFCYFFGWTQGSAMARRYIHESADLARKAINRLHNKGTQEDEKDDLLDIVVCDYCGESYPAFESHCRKCVLPLNVENQAQQARRERMEARDDLLARIEALENASQERIAGVIADEVKRGARRPIGRQ